MKKFKKLSLLILTALLVFSGCTPKNTQPAQTSSESKSLHPPVPEIEVVSGEGKWLGEGGCYKLSDTGLGDSNRNIMVFDNAIYTLHYNFGSNNFALELRRDQEVLFCSATLKTAAVGSLGIWIVSDSADYSQTTESQYQLIRLDKDGQEVFHRDLAQDLAGSYPIKLQTYKDDSLLLLLEDRVLVYDADGSLSGSIPLEEGMGLDLICGGDGSSYAALYKEDADVSGQNTTETNYLAVRLDPERQTAENVMEYGEDYRICDGNKEYLFTFLNEEGLYGVVSPQDAMSTIAIWTELGADFYSPGTIAWLEDGSFVVTDSTMTALFRPGDPNEVKRKKLLTMAQFSPHSSFQKTVKDFNMSSSEYVLKMIDYSQGGECSATEALQALNMDLVAGNAPDLLDLTDISQSYFAEKGILEDLSSYLEQDPDIGPDDFILFDKLKEDERLYCVTSSYYVETAAGLSSLFDKDTGVSLDEYLDLQSRFSGDIMYNVTRESFLRSQLYRYTTYSVDWDAGTCDFESEEFLKILNSIQKIRENPAPENSFEVDITPPGQRLKNHSLILSACFVDKVTSLARLEAETGEPLCFVGFPTPDGKGGTRLLPRNLIGMCSLGQKDDAWSFIKYVLTQDAENWKDSGIPSPRKLLEDQIGKALSPAQDGEEKLPFTQADAEKLYAFLDTAVYYGTPAEEVMRIVMEEAAPYLAGDKSAEETAHVIQSRVSLLAAE